jgi:hypothetical protein
MVLYAIKKYSKKMNFGCCKYSFPEAILSRIFKFLIDKNGPLTIMDLSQNQLKYKTLIPIFKEG